MRRPATRRTPSRWLRHAVTAIVGIAVIDPSSAFAGTQFDAVTTVRPARVAAAGDAVAGRAKPSTGGPEAAPGPRSPEDYLALALALREAGDLAAAEAMARKGLHRFPDGGAFHLFLGETLLERKQPVEAFYELQHEALREGIARATGLEAAKLLAPLLESHGPEVDEIRLVVGALNAIRSDPASAIQMLEKVQSTRGERFVLTLFLAEATAAAGNRAGAVALYRRLHERDPGFVPAYVELAKLLRYSDPGEADRLMELARRRDPTNWSLAR